MAAFADTAGPQQQAEQPGVTLHYEEQSVCQCKDDARGGQSRSKYLNFTSPHTGQLVAAAATTLRDSSNSAERRKDSGGKEPKEET